MMPQPEYQALCRPEILEKWHPGGERREKTSLTQARSPSFVTIGRVVAADQGRAAGARLA
jgi:hypothetical protein